MHQDSKTGNLEQHKADSEESTVNNQYVDNKAIVTSIAIKDGCVVCYKYPHNVNSQTIFKPNNGDDSIVLFGVCCDYGNMLGYPYQLNGIKVGKSPSTSFTVGMLIHEFGHHLQQQELGTFRFMLYAGIGSAIANIYQRFGGDYYSIYSERDASFRGQAYINEYYPTCNYLAVGL